MKATLYTDGGSRGNPGPAAFAYVLEADDGTVLAAHGETIGVATNNVAEYRGLVAGLAKAVELAVSDVEVVSDSELLVKQMLGEYKVKNEALRELSRIEERRSFARRVGRWKGSKRGRPSWTSEGPARPHVLGGCPTLKRLAQLAHHRHIERIKFFRAVDGDGGDLVVLVELDVLKVHSKKPYRGSHG